MNRRGLLVALVMLVTVAVGPVRGGRPAFAAPTPDTGGPYSGVAGQPVAMSAVNSVNAVSWQWDFGDGTSAAGLRVSKTYTFPGEYAVTLTTTDPAGTPAMATTLVTVRSDGTIPTLAPFACFWVVIDGLLTCASSPVTSP